MSGFRQPLHARNHRPGGEDPLPLDAFAESIGKQVRYIVGHMSGNRSDLHTYVASAPQSIDGDTSVGNTIPFSTWESNDDGAVFSNDGAGGFSATATANQVSLKAAGLYVCFAFTLWTAAGLDAARFGINAFLSNSELSLDKSMPLSTLFWDNYAQRSVLDDTGATDFAVRDQRWAWFTSADPSHVASAALDITAISGGVSTNTFYSPQIAVVWVGNLPG